MKHNLIRCVALCRSHEGFGITRIVHLMRSIQSVCQHLVTLAAIHCCLRMLCDWSSIGLDAHHAHFIRSGAKRKHKGARAMISILRLSGINLGVLSNGISLAGWGLSESGYSFYEVSTDLHQNGTQNREVINASRPDVKWTIAVTRQ